MPLTTRRTLLVAAFATVALRAWYAVVLWYNGTDAFAGTWVGPSMRLEAVVNVAAIGFIVAAVLVRQNLVLWLACLAAIAIQALPGARIGLSASLLLPWVTATTLCLALVVAWQRSPRLTWITAGIAFLGGALLPLRMAWGAIDYYIALVVALTAVLLTTLPAAEETMPRPPGRD